MKRKIIVYTYYYLYLCPLFRLNFFDNVDNNITETILLFYYFYKIFLFNLIYVYPINVSKCKFFLYCFISMKVY